MAILQPYRLLQGTRRRLEPQQLPLAIYRAVKRTTFFKYIFIVQISITMNLNTIPNYHTKYSE